MADYIYPAPGVSNVEATLKLHHTSKATDSAGMLVPSLQDITVNAANDVFTWTQLDAAAKKQIATTATNSLGMNLVVNQTSFFGNYTELADASAQTTWESGTPTTSDYAYRLDTKAWLVGDGAGGSTAVTGQPAVASVVGIFGLSTYKARVQFDLYLGDESDGTAGKHISGTGYVTGLAPTVSADAPVWVTPITITIDSDYQVSDNALA
jgi:hypothetical protein